MANVTQAVQYLISLEGNSQNHYYSNSIHDSGGETYMGISRRWNPTWEGWKIVDALKSKKDFPVCLGVSPELDELVPKFYEGEYWDKYKLNLIADQWTAGKILALLVNTGKNHGTEIIQKAINNLYIIKEGILIDGILGPKTIAAINKCPPDGLIDKITIESCEYYLRIVDRNRAQVPNFVGWIRRALAG